MNDFDEVVLPEDDFDEVLFPGGGGSEFASIFADPGDIARYRRAKAAGLSDQEAFRYGDNGIGKWGDDTTREDDPIVALPRDTPGLRHNQAVEVSGPGGTVIARVADVMPARRNLKGRASIDLNPAAAAAVGHSGGINRVNWRFIDTPVPDLASSDDFDEIIPPGGGDFDEVVQPDFDEVISPPSPTATEPLPPGPSESWDVAATEPQQPLFPEPSATPPMLDEFAQASGQQEIERNAGALFPEGVNRAAETVVKPLALGMANAPKSLLQANDYLNQWFYKPIDAAFGSDLSNSFNARIVAREAEMDARRQEAMRVGGPTWGTIGVGLGEQIPQLPVQMAAGGVGAMVKGVQGAVMASAALGSLQSASSTFGDAVATRIQQGENPEKAAEAELIPSLTNGLITAAATAAGGATGFESIFAKQGARGVMGKMVETLKQGGFEVAEEVSDEAGQIANDLINSRTVTPEEALKRVGHAAVIASILGTGVSGLHNALSGSEAAEPRPPLAPEPPRMAPSPEVPTAVEPEIDAELERRKYGGGEQYATEEGIESEGYQREYPGDETRGTPAEAGYRGGDEPSGQVAEEIGEVVEQRPEPVNKPYRGFVTGTANVRTEAEIEEYGLEPALQSAKRDFPTVWGEAERMVEKDHGLPGRLVEQLTHKRRPLSDTENALLLQHQIATKKAHRAAMAAVNANPDDEAARDNLEATRNELQKVYDVARLAGEEGGRGQSARRMLARDDFSLESMLVETRAVRGGAPLSKEQAAEVKELHDRLLAAEARVAAYETSPKNHKKLARQQAAVGRSFNQFLEEQAAAAAKRKAERTAGKSERLAPKTERLAEKAKPMTADVPLSRQKGALIAESGRTTEDFKLKPDSGFSRKMRSAAMKIGDRVIEGRSRADNHADISARLGFPKDAIPGFVDQQGRFHYQFAEDAPKQDVPVARQKGVTPSAIAGPALLTPDGQVIVSGRIGQTHRDLMREAMGTPNEAAAVDALANDAQHGFVDTDGNVVKTREEAAERAVARGQAPEGTTRLQSEQLQEPPLKRGVDARTGLRYSLADETRRAFQPSKDTSASLALSALAAKIGRDPSHRGIGRPTLTRVEFPSRGTAHLPDAKSIAAARLLARRSNSEIVYFRSDRPVRVNGAQVGKRLLINVDSTVDPVASIAGHEVWHGIQRSDPKLAAEVQRLVQVNRERYGEYRAERQKVGYPREELTDEFMSDLVGEAMTDPRRLRATVGNLADRVLAHIQQWIDKALQYLRIRAKAGPQAESASAAVTNLEQVRDRIVQALRAKPETGRVSDIPLSRQRGQDQTKTPEFKRWFGDSKVVDENGEPLRVYHGTTAAEDFNAFDSRLGWFSPSPETAKAYAVGQYNQRGGSGRTIPAYLSIKNPLRADGFSVEKAKSEGYDGAVTSKGNWIPFYPQQIKSATGNRGTFDPSDPDIRFARQAAAVDPDADDDLVIGAHVMSKTGRRLEQWSEAMNAQGIAPTKELFNRTLKYYGEISKEFAPARGKPTPQDRAAKRKENIRGRIASLRDRMRRGDYTETPKRAKFEMDEEELTLRFEESEAKRAFRDFIEKHRRANSRFLNKTGDFLGQTIGVARDMKTGYDISAAGRQGKKLGMKHPVLFAKAFARQLAALTSEKRAFKEQQRIANSKYVKNGVAHQAGLRLTDQNSQFEVKRDEHFGSRFDKFIPGVKASGRAYSAFLNSLRYDVFEIMVDAFGDTPARRKIIASMINIETGQADISPKLASTYVHLNKILFAPRWTTSIPQFLVNVPAWKALAQGDPKMAARMGWEQAKTVAGLAAWYAMLGALLGALDDKERPKLGLNPLKKDEFLTLRFGDSRVDASAGVKQFMTFAAQYLSGRAIAKTGQEKDLRSTKFGARKIGDVGTQYVRSRLNPLVGGAYSAHSGFDFLNRPTTWTKEAIGLPMPMQAETAYELFRDQPNIRMAIALMLDSTIGDSVNSYSDNWKVKKPDLTDIIESKILRKKLATATEEE